MLFFFIYLHQSTVYLLDPSGLPSQDFSSKSIKSSQSLLQTSYSDHTRSPSELKKPPSTSFDIMHIKNLFLVLCSTILAQSALITETDNPDIKTPRVEFFWDDSCNDIAQTRECAGSTVGLRYGGPHGSRSARFAILGTEMVYWDIHSYEGVASVQQSVPYPAILQCVTFTTGSTGVEAFVRLMRQA